MVYASTCVAGKERAGGKSGWSIVAAKLYLVLTFPIEVLRQGLRLRTS